MTYTLNLTKTTKNTYRYDNADEDAGLRTLYVQQTSFPGGAPQSITVNIQGTNS